MAVYDFSWHVEEREAKEGRQFVLLGLKGQIFVYPTEQMRHPEDFYTRSDALAHAMLAASAPRMLSMLEELAQRLEIYGSDDPTLTRWAQQMRRDIAALQKADG